MRKNSFSLSYISLTVLCNGYHLEYLWETHSSEITGWKLIEYIMQTRRPYILQKPNLLLSETTFSGSNTFLHIFFLWSFLLSYLNLTWNFTTKNHQQEVLFLESSLLWKVFWHFFRPCRALQKTKQLLYIHKDDKDGIPK